MKNKRKYYIGLIGVIRKII